MEIIEYFLINWMNVLDIILLWNEKETLVLVSQIKLFCLGIYAQKQIFIS